MNDAGPFQRTEPCWFGQVEVVANERLARDTWRLRLHAPAVAATIRPAQFVMVRLAGRRDPLLGRPLALYDTAVDDAGRPTYLDVVHLVVGRMTAALADLAPGAKLELWGPLGFGFSLQPVDHLVMVAGGIGQTPFLAVAQERLGLARYGGAEPPPVAARATLCYGARAADLLAGVADFQALGVDVRLTTDDGSAGRRGLTTDSLVEVLDEAAAARPDESVRVLCCGPEPMMAAVARLAAEREVPCEVSLETPMACGLGVCFSCAAPVVKPDGGFDYVRTCIDGPVFPAETIDWPRLCGR